jgi:uncharacterized membrane protein YczE
VPTGLTRRLVQLYAGLILYGLSMVLFVESTLGVMPWDVFHQGVADRAPLSMGMVTILTGAVVLALWWPLRVRPGLGTISNVIVIGIAFDVAHAVLPTPDGWGLRLTFLVAGVVLNGVATAAYIGARFGPGPRDGLMTGLAARTGRSVRLVRTSIEVVVLAIGVALGGTVGVGTVVYAVAIGPLVHRLLPMFEAPAPPVAGPAGVGRAPTGPPA